MLMTIVVAMWACSQIANSTDLTHRYKNPSFSGIGTSANYAKFIKNLESRIYARFSKEMEEALFGEACGSTWDGGAISNPNSAVTNNEDTSFGDCSGEMNFNGTNIKFTKDASADEVRLEINGPDGNSTITLPLNDFQF